MRKESMLALLGKNNKSNKPIGFLIFPIGITEKYNSQCKINKKSPIQLMTSKSIR